LGGVTAGNVREGSGGVNPRPTKLPALQILQETALYLAVMSSNHLSTPKTSFIAKLPRDFAQTVSY
jgi:hypothetical protein